jgi:hypothetical protein
MIEVYYAPSFLRIIKKLAPHLKEKVKETTSKVIDFYVSAKGPKAWASPACVIPYGKQELTSVCGSFTTFHGIV